MRRTRNASKSTSKAVLPDKQQSLLHYYKKKSAQVDGAMNTTAESMSNRNVSPGPRSIPDPFPPLLNDEITNPSSSKTAVFSVATAKTKEHQSLNGISEIADLSNAPPVSDALLGVPEDSAHKENQVMQEASLLRLTHPSLQPGQEQEISLEKPLTEEVHKALKPNLTQPLLSQASSITGEPSLNQHASSSKTPFAPRKANNEGTVQQDVVDCAESSDHEGRNAYAHTTATYSIVFIDDDTESYGSKDFPIEIGSSPVLTSRATKVPHPFFSRRTLKAKEVDHGVPLPPKGSLRMVTPWPSSQQQHVQGPQNRFWPVAALPYPISQRRTYIPEVYFSTKPNLRFLETGYTSQTDRAFVPSSHTFSPVELEREDILSKMPKSHRDHPAIARLLNINPESVDNGEAWSHKWRPRSASEVLGNEDNLRNIKDWLQSLEIRTEQMLSEHGDAEGSSKATTRYSASKRPTVVRAVESRRARKRRKVESDDESSLEGWIVQDDEEEETAEFLTHNGHLGPSNSMFSESFSGKHDEPLLRESAELTNTILLTGPPGSGKTASVYACAEELGWEVFEVYPGIGKRSSANMSSLVGDVAKNHVVGRRGAGKSESMSGSIQSKIKSSFGFLSQDHRKESAVSEDSSREVRQSVILLEEVDILFKDDTNFWPAVVSIIKSSHRPIFMTCNDISVVPLDDLPLQAILRFQPCPCPLAISYLQAVCLAEGQVIPKSQLHAMYSTTHEVIGPDQPDAPHIPFPSQPRASRDLRRVLNELQSWCQRESFTGAGETALDVKASSIAEESYMEALTDWSGSRYSVGTKDEEEVESRQYDFFRIWRHVDCVSFVDGYLERRPSDVLEALAIDRYGPSDDDEIGHVLLEKSRTELSSYLAFYSKDEAISRDLLSRSRHVLEASGAGPRARKGLLSNGRGSAFDSRSLVRDRAANQLQVASYLDDVIPLSAPLLPQAPAILEYATYMRQMVSADDELESGRRETRTGRQFGGHRYLTLSVQSVEAARGTRIGVGLS